MTDDTLTLPSLIEDTTPIPVVTDTPVHTAGFWAGAGIGTTFGAFSGAALVLGAWTGLLVLADWLGVW